MPTITIKKTKTELIDNKAVEKEYEVKYLVKDVLLMEDLEKVNIYSLYCLSEEMKDEKKKMELALDIKAFKAKFDPLINVCLTDKIDTGKLTFAEYLTIAMHESVMGAFTKSMEGMPKLPEITNPTSKKV